MSAGSSAFRGKPATKSSIATRSTGSKPYRIARAGRCATPISCRRRSQASSSAAGAKSRIGARKIRELLVRKLDGDFRVPAKSTIHAVLCRNGVVKALGRPPRRAGGTPLSAGAAPNDLWCADFKGEFKLGDGRYCYPLTVTDHASRFLLLCEALESTREDLAVTAFERLFRERGLPQTIRSDNGVPFASPNGLSTAAEKCATWRRESVPVGLREKGRKALEFGIAASI
jgi:transposase InsO family protein